MSDERVMPPLGQEQIARVCQRYAGSDEKGDDLICGEPATFHVIWNVQTMDNAYCCLDHAREATERWNPDAWHQMGPFCGMPGALFFLPPNECRYEDGLPVVEETRELAVS